MKLFKAESFLQLVEEVREIWGIKEIWLEDVGGYVKGIPAALKSWERAIANSHLKETESLVL